MAWTEGIALSLDRDEKDTQTKPRPVCRVSADWQSDSLLYGAEAGALRAATAAPA